MGFLEQLDNDLEDMTSGEFSEEFTIDGEVLDPPLMGIFDLTYFEVDAEGATVQSKNSRLGVAYDKLTERIGYEIDEDSKKTITIRNIDYKINHVEPDGAGFASIILSKI